MDNKTFWNNPVLIFFRWILFIPLEFIGIGLIVTLVFLFVGWLIKIGWGWFIAFIFLGGFLHSIINMLIMSISVLLVSICPKKKVGAISYMIIALSNSIYAIIKIWRSFENPEIFEVVLSVLFTIINLYILWGMIMGSVLLISDE